MANALPSQPPPAGVDALDRPSIVKAGMARARVASRDAVARWRARNRISDSRMHRYLAACSQNQMTERSNGRAPWPIELVYAVAETDAELAADLLEEIRDDVRALRRSA